MDLPEISEYTTDELMDTLDIHPSDEGTLDFYRLPLAAMLAIIHKLPPTVKNKHDYEIRLDNWTNMYEGYEPWAIPDLLADDPLLDDPQYEMRMMQRKMSLPMMYRGHDFPEIQLGKILSRPFVKRLNTFSNSEEFAALGKKMYVLKVELSPCHTSTKEPRVDRTDDPVVVWRLLTCFGDTNLNSFHDQILAPAMGWRRNFHAYRYTVPTNGASLFPEDTSSMDKMHLTFSHPIYSLDTEDYDVRHVLRKVGDRLIYNYDMGDNWCHIIKVLATKDVGDALHGCDMELVDTHVFEAIPRKQWVLQSSSLLWGEVNCPPENSEGCDGMGEYGSILKRGRHYEVPDAENIINWNDHDIQCAFDFDLEAHRERFEAANAGRQNSRMGVLAFARDPSAMGLDSSVVSPTALNADCIYDTPSSGKEVKKVDATDRSSEIVRQKTVTSLKCNHCGRVKGSNSGLKLSKCSRCKKVYYCSKDCQRKDWKEHKRACQRKKK